MEVGIKRLPDKEGGRNKVMQSWIGELAGWGGGQVRPCGVVHALKSSGVKARRGKEKVA